MPSLQDVYKKARRSVVRIETSQGTGTGWVMEDGWVLTAEHVVANFSAVTIRFLDATGSSQTVSGTVVGTDRLLDLAAIRVDGSPGVRFDAPMLPVRDVFTTDTGEPVISLGYSTGPIGSPSVRVGVITTVFKLAGTEGGASETDAQFDPGDSGGPLIDAQGRVVAVAQAQKTQTSAGQRVIGQQLAINAGQILRVWKQLKAGEHLNPSAQYWWKSA